jgi:hypothetical protein
MKATVWRGVGAVLATIGLAAAALSPTKPAAAVIPHFPVSINPAVGVNGTRVELVARQLEPRTGTVEFSVLSAAGARTTLGTVNVTSAGTATLRVRMRDEGIIIADHIFPQGEGNASITGGTNFRFRSTPPSNVVIDVTQRAIVDAPETSGGYTYGVSGQHYVVVPTAPVRGTSDFKVTCSSGEAIALPGSSPDDSINNVCVAPTAGLNTMTVSDRFGQYRPVSFTWRSTVPIRTTLTEGDVLSWDLPAGATLVQTTDTSFSCVNRRCTFVVGAALQPGQFQEVTTLTIPYQLPGETFWTAQTWVIQVRPRATTTTSTTTTTTPPTTVAASANIAYQSVLVTPRTVSVTCETAKGSQTVHPPIGASQSTLTYAAPVTGTCSVSVTPPPDAANRTWFLVDGICEPNGQAWISGQQTTTRCVIAAARRSPTLIRIIESTPGPETFAHPITGPNGETGTVQLTERLCEINFSGIPSGPPPPIGRSFVLRICKYEVGTLAIPGVANGPPNTLPGFVLNGTLTATRGPMLQASTGFGSPFSLPLNTVGLIDAQTVLSEVGNGKGQTTVSLFSQPMVLSLTRSSGSTTTVAPTTIAPTTLAPTTVPPTTVGTTVPPTTVRGTAQLTVNPSAVKVGSNVILTVSGLGSAVGRVDFSIAGQHLGSATIQNGTASATVAAWSVGNDLPVLGSVVTYAGGVPTTRTVTGTITVTQ